MARELKTPRQSLAAWLAGVARPGTAALIEHRAREAYRPKTFREWLTQQSERRGYIGDLARDSADMPESVVDLELLLSHMRATCAPAQPCDGAVAAAKLAWSEYKRECA